jgi:hypothetical protein
VRLTGAAAAGAGTAETMEAAEAAVESDLGVKSLAEIVRLLEIERKLTNLKTTFTKR